MAKYKYRHRETYKDMLIDIKANSSKDLADKIKKKKYEIDRLLMDADIRFKSFVDLYMKSYRENSVLPDSYSSLEYMANKIVDGIGNVKVMSIKPLQVQEFLNSLTDHKDGYIKKIYNLTCAIFQHAYRNGLTTTDYTIMLEKPKGRIAQSGRSLTDRERELLLEILPGHRGEIFCKLMLYCGIRPGEAIALQWRDIDLKNETLTVSKSYKRSGIVGEPKSSAAHRIIPIPEHLIPLLREHNGSPFDPVCQNNGSRYTEGGRRAMWKSVRRQMNIAAGCTVERNKVLPPLLVDNGFTMYNLRHTYCTDLERAGVSINIARRLMGHSSIMVTSRIYTHDNDESLERARDLINRNDGKMGKSTGKISAIR